MSYTKTNWENKPSKKTPIDAENLNHMENGIAEAHEQLDNLPQWSKQEEKPKYTYDEVGADEQGTAEKLVDSHNKSKMSHEDIRTELSELERYKNIAIADKVEGTFIHVTDSANVKLLDVGLEGKTEQKTYQGKNLFDLYNTDFKNKKEFTITNEELYTDNISYCSILLQDTCIPFESEEQITVSAQCKCGTVTMLGICVLYEDGTYTLGNRATNGSYFSSKVTSDESKKVVGIGFSYGENGSGYVKNIMINAGSVATEYEPYVGGIPSPNPQYPQEIVNAGVPNEDTGKYEIGCKVFNKNTFLLDKLIKIASETSGVEIVNFDGRRCLHIMNINSLYSKKAIYNQPFREGRYTLRYDTYIISISVEGSGFAMQYEQGGIKYFLPKAEQAPLNKWITISGTTSDGFICESLVVSYGSLSESYIDLDSIQLESGTEQTVYEPPQQQPFTLTSDRPITKWDKLVKRDGVWGWSYASNKYKITGNEDWYVPSADNDYLTGPSSNMYFLPKNIVNNEGSSLIQSVFSEKFSYVRYVWVLTDGTEGIAANTNQIHIRIANSTLGVFDEASNDEKKEAFVKYLQSQYNDGNPIIVYYESAEQAFIPLSDEEQSLLNSLETYYGVTNVYNDQGCPMWIEYVADTKKYIEQNYAPKSEIEEMKNQIVELQTLVVNNV